MNSRGPTGVPPGARKGRARPPLEPEAEPIEGRSEVAALAEAFRRGDEDALERLLPPLRARLTRIAKQRLPGEHVEEAVQETLATLWEKRGEVGSAERFLPFVFQVLRNKIGNLYLRFRREKTRAADGERLEGVPADPAASDPGLQAEGKELERILGEAIGACAAESAVSGEVLGLLWQGKTAAEICERLGGVPRSTALSRIHRARNLLRMVLRERYRLEV